MPLRTLVGTESLLPVTQLTSLSSTCTTEARPVSAHPLGAAQYPISVGVSPQN